MNAHCEACGVVTSTRQPKLPACPRCGGKTKRGFGPRQGDIYCTSYCNKGHLLKNGKPVAHECRVIPVEALLAERDGDVPRAISLLAANDLNGRGLR